MCVPYAIPPCLRVEGSKSQLHRKCGECLFSFVVSMISCLPQDMLKGLRSSGNILVLSKASNCESQNVMTCIQGIPEYQKFYKKSRKKNLLLRCKIPPITLHTLRP
jgi:hypothetical protein